MKAKRVDIFAPQTAIDLFAPRRGRRTRAEVTVADERTYRRRALKRAYLHALHVANAAKLVDRLPDEGESIHAIMRGNFHAWDLVPAVLRLAAPATIADIYIATLSFNRDNTLELVRLLDSGQVGRVTFICSCYFRDATPDEFNFMARELERRRQRVLAMRNHAKIQAMRLTDGRDIVIESSANLRSCRNAEQFCMTQDRGLYLFHAGWMNDVLAKAGQ